MFDEDIFVFFHQRGSGGEKFTSEESIIEDSPVKVFSKGLGLSYWLTLCLARVNKSTAKRSFRGEGKSSYCYPQGRLSAI